MPQAFKDPQPACYFLQTFIGKISMEIFDMAVAAAASIAGFLVGFAVRAGISARRRVAVRRRRAFFNSILAERPSEGNDEDA